MDQNLFQKIYFFFNLKLNGRKLGFNTPLSALPKDTASELGGLFSTLSLYC